MLGLATVAGQTGRAVTLTVAYCLGLGLPFLAFGVGFRRVLGLFARVRRHSRWVTRIGGALLVLVGLALVTGAWTGFMDWLRAAVGPGSNLSPATTVPRCRRMPHVRLHPRRFGRSLPPGDLVRGRSNPRREDAKCQPL